MAMISAMPATITAKEVKVPEAAASAGLEVVAPHAIGMAAIEQHHDWPLLSRLPMRLCAGIPLRRFRVKDLLALKEGQLITSSWVSTEDVPLKIGAVQLSWSEFEVVGQRMAVRLTRLA